MRFPTRWHAGLKGKSSFGVRRPRTIGDDFCSERAQVRNCLRGPDLFIARCLWFGALAFSALLPATSFACEGLYDGPTGTVTGVIDGDTVTLDSGISVRLIGAEAPALANGRKGITSAPLAEAAKAALEKLALGKSVRLALGGDETDRYGHMLAQMYVAGQPEVWAQQAMLAAGLARAYSLPQNRNCLSELLVAEQTARTNTLGIWADPYYSVRDAADPGTLATHMGRYELVEGKILGTGRARDRVYLDFGKVWKEDFTVVIDKKAQGLLATAGIDPMALTGKTVRVRGWVEMRDGPAIAVTQPEQIEVLSSL